MSEVGCSHFLRAKTGQYRTVVNRAQAPYNQMQTLHVVADAEFKLMPIRTGEDNTNNGVPAIPPGRSVYPTKVGYGSLKSRFLTITIHTFSGSLPHACLSFSTCARLWK